LETAAPRRRLNWERFWNNPHALLIELNYKEEKRFGPIARLEESQKPWIVIFTTRSASIRIISVRRARTELTGSGSKNLGALSALIIEI
jgi:hypothetical protein